LVLFDFLTRVKAVHNRHLKVHNNYSVPSIFAIWILTCGAFIALFEQLERILSIECFVELNFTVAVNKILLNLLTLKLQIEHFQWINIRRPNFMSIYFVWSRGIVALFWLEFVCHFNYVFFLSVFEIRLHADSLTLVYK